MKLSETKINDFVAGKLPENEKKAIKQAMTKDKELEQRVTDKVVEGLTLKELERSDLKAKMQTWEQARKRNQIVPLRRALRIAASIAIFGVIATLLLPYINNPQVGTKSVGQVSNHTELLGNWAAEVVNPTSKLALDLQLNADETFQLGTVATYNNDAQATYQFLGGGAWKYDASTKVMQFSNLKIEPLSTENSMAIQPIQFDVEIALQQIGFNGKSTLTYPDSNQLQWQYEGQNVTWLKK